MTDKKSLSNLEDKVNANILKDDISSRMDPRLWHMKNKGVRQSHDSS